MYCFSIVLFFVCLFVCLFVCVRVCVRIVSGRGASWPGKWFNPLVVIVRFEEFMSAQILSRNAGSFFRGRLGAASSGNPALRL